MQGSIDFMVVSKFYQGLKQQKNCANFWFSCKKRTKWKAPPGSKCTPNAPFAVYQVEKENVIVSEL